MTKRAFGNKTLFVLSMLSYTTAVNLISNGYIQSFMLNLGLGTEDVASLGAVSTAFAMCAYLLFSIFRPKNGDYYKTMLINAFLMALYPACLLISGLFGGKTALALILGGNALYCIFLAFKYSSEFTVIPRLFPRSEYGSVVGKSGSIGCLIAAAISLIGAAMISPESGNAAYIGFFAVAFLFMVLSAWFGTRYKLIKNPEEAQESASHGGIQFRQLFERIRDRSFLMRMLPHFLRGAGMAGIYYFPMVGMQRVALNAVQSGYLIVVGVAAQLMGNLLFARLCKRIRSGWLVLVPFGIEIACLLLVPFVDGVIGFLALYFVLLLFTCISDCAIPNGVLRSTASEDLPMISSLRMMACNGVNCILVMAFGRMIDVYPFVTMLIAAAIYLAGGVMYFHHFRDQMKD